MSDGEVTIIEEGRDTEMAQELGIDVFEERVNAGQIIYSGSEAHAEYLKSNPPVDDSNLSDEERAAKAEADRLAAEANPPVVDKPLDDNAVIAYMKAKYGFTPEEFNSVIADKGAIGKTLSDYKAVVGSKLNPYANERIQKINSFVKANPNIPERVAFSIMDASVEELASNPATAVAMQKVIDSDGALSMSQALEYVNKFYKKDEEGFEDAAILNADGAGALKKIKELQSSFSIEEGAEGDDILAGLNAQSEKQKRREDRYN